MVALRWLKICSLALLYTTVVQAQTACSPEAGPTAGDCETDSQICPPTIENSKECRACHSAPKSTECGTAYPDVKPICKEGICDACTSDSECVTPYPTQPICKADGTACVACNKPDDCPVAASTCTANTCVAPAAAGWCLPPGDQEYCSVEDGYLVKVTVNMPGSPNICAQTEGVDCDTDTLEKIKDIENQRTCRTACDGGTCKAFTYVSKGSPKNDDCYWLAACGAPPLIDPDVCAPFDKCSGGEICANPGDALTECPGTGCTEPKPVCSESGLCVEETRCKTPEGVNHDYTKPGNQHWTEPCLRPDSSEDTPCDIYFDGGMCQENTVCTLQPKCKTGANAGLVTHTCEGGQWIHKVNGAGTGVATGEQWKDPFCNACETPLLITPEPGLSLICSKLEPPLEPELENNKYKITEGPCNLFCNGIYIHHISCDPENGIWKADDGSVDEFYCWNKPTL